MMNDDDFRVCYGHAAVFINYFRIDHSLQSNFVRFLCVLKLGLALCLCLLPVLLSISA